MQEPYALVCSAVDLAEHQQEQQQEQLLSTSIWSFSNA
jgi:hypothetical protein